MAGKNYFLSIFAVILLTLGLLYVVDPRALMGLLVGIGKVVLGVSAAGLLIIGIAMLQGPVEP